MTMDGDVMRMRQVDAIDVPAGRTVELKPGGLHLMFMDLKAPLTNGTRFPLTLRFEKAGEVQVQVQVQPLPPAGAAAGGGHHGTHKH
jgi:copper(I)-binding protein